MSLKKLTGISKKSELMNVSIKFGDETFVFNLREELNINMDGMDHEFNDQLASHSFLSMLKEKLTLKRDDLEAAVNHRRSQLFVELKTKIDRSTGRPPSDDLVNAKIALDDEFRIANKKLRDVKRDLGTITTCFYAFSNRKDLLQTLSANKRKEPY